LGQQRCKTGNSEPLSKKRAFVMKKGERERGIRGRFEGTGTAEKAKSLRQGKGGKPKPKGDLQGGSNRPETLGVPRNKTLKQERGE